MVSVADNEEYSFVSDEDGDYSFHLTDQYIVNNNNVLQKIQTQGYYKDTELTLWTTPEIKDNIREISCLSLKIEDIIMGSDNVETLVQDIIDGETIRFGNSNSLPVKQ